MLTCPGETGVFSTDEEDSDSKDDSEEFPPQNAELPVINVDRRIEAASTQPELDTYRGPSFPEVPPLNLDFSPSNESEEARRANYALSETDENFIRNSMSAINIAPPPWASTVNETNWKDELRKHLAKD